MYSMPKSSEAVQKLEGNNEKVPITGEQPKRSPYANPVKHDTIYSRLAMPLTMLRCTRWSIVSINHPENWARIATTLAQTRHHVRGNPYFCRRISDEVPAVIRPTQLDKEIIETCAAWIFERDFECSCESPLSSNKASTQWPTFYGSRVSETSDEIATLMYIKPQPLTRQGILIDR
jgi:hypothetical protein